MHSTLFQVIAAEPGTVVIDVGDNITSILLALIAGIPAIIAAFYAHKATRQATSAAEETRVLRSEVNGRMDERVTAARAEGKLEALTDRRGSPVVGAPAAVVNVSHDPAQPAPEGIPAG